MYQVNLIGLLVKDIDKTVEFYERVFNFKVVGEKTANPKGETRAFIKGGNIIIELTQLAGGVPAAPEGAIDHIGFFVENLEEEIERIKRIGVNLKTDIEGHIPTNTILRVGNGRIFYFRGINGESIGLIQLNEDSRFI